MHLLKRSEVCRLLSLSAPQSYRVVGTTMRRDGMISSDALLDLLNARRAGAQERLECVTPLVRAEEACVVAGVSCERLKDMCSRRTKKVPPSFALSRGCRRFCVDSLRRWFEEGTRIVRRGEYHG